MSFLKKNIQTKEINRTFKLNVMKQKKIMSAENEICKRKMIGKKYDALKPIRFEKEKWNKSMLKQNIVN